MTWLSGAATVFLLAGSAAAAGQERHHDHGAPEKLGAVTFATSCNAALKPAFDRAIALLHSFAYASSLQAFRDVSARDPGCAMARWGMAMAHYHQLWEPPSGEDLREAAEEVRIAAAMPGSSARERGYIDALAAYYRDADRVAHGARAERYAQAMAEVARGNPDDSEAQIFYALALIATAAPTDKSHRNQKRAAAILEPIYRRQPQHPGLAHYLIHACDSAELAPRGLGAARAYSRIAPSAPHALHMPSHVFTRLGYWEDSIASNQAARTAAHAQGDPGEELHAMDYLTYAYLQLGRHAEARQVVGAARSMSQLQASQFKMGYAATAMPIRLAVESRDWASAAKLGPLPGSPPHVAALVYWARALGNVRAKVPSSPDADIDRLQACLDALRASGNVYWATQVDVMVKEVQAWHLAAKGEPAAALLSLRAAADEEDAVEKLPVTPGPIVPAREQLGDLLLALDHPGLALREYNAALALAPGRLGALKGVRAATERLGNVRSAR
jgi:tetratricopeptide (TPR) repeat protein